MKTLIAFLTVLFFAIGTFVGVKNSNPTLVDNKNYVDLMSMPFTGSDGVSFLFEKDEVIRDPRTNLPEITILADLKFIEKKVVEKKKKQTEETVIVDEDFELFVEKSSLSDVVALINLLLDSETIVKDCIFCQKFY